MLLTASCVTMPHVSVSEAMLKRETAVWEAAQATKPDVFGAFLDPAYSGVYADGVHSRAAEIEAVNQEHLRSFAINDAVAKQLDPQTQMLTYKVSVKGDFAGTDFSGDYWAVSLWHLTGGMWMLVAHAEAKLQ